MGSYTFIKRKTEDAFEKLIVKYRGNDLQYTTDAGATANVPIFKVMSGVEFITPRIMLGASAEPEMFGDDENVGGFFIGNWFVTITAVIVSSPYDVPRATHAERCGVIGDLFMRRDLPEQINNLTDLPDFKAYTWRPGESGADSISEDTVMTPFEGKLYCAPSVVET